MAIQSMNSALAANDYSGAIRIGSEHLGKVEDPRVRFTLGNAYFYKREYELALKEYLALHESYPSDELVLSNVGKSQFILGEYKEASAYLAKSIQAREGETLYSLLAESLILSGQDAAAIPLLQGELWRRPDDKKLYHALAELHRRRGDFEEAGRMAEAWLSTRSLDNELVRILAQVRLVEGRTRESRALFQILESLGDCRAQDLRQLADLYLVERSYPEAVRYLLLLQDRGELSRGDRERLAIAYARMGQASQAVDVLKLLVEQKETASLWTQLGVAYEFLKDSDRSTQAFEKASSLDAHDPEPILALGRIHFREKRLDQAEESYWKATALEGGAARAYAGLGEIAWKKGTRREAISFYKTAKDLDPTDARIYDRWVALTRRIGG